MNGTLHDRALIVAKTHLGAAACIGALALDGNRSLRLMKSTGNLYPADVGFAVGQLWELSYRPRPAAQPPHVEDVYVRQARRLGEQAKLKEFLLARVQPWSGGPDTLFDGYLRSTNSSKRYCSGRAGLPGRSTGFWIPDQPLRKTVAEHKMYYRYGEQAHALCCDLPYVGYAPAVDLIPAGSLVRVSLARPWQPPGTAEERCYLQLSGWYE